MEKLVKFFAIVLVSLCALGCETLLNKVHIEDHEWCSDLGSYGAECFYILSDKERSLNGAEWYQERTKERFGQICGTPAAYSNIKTVVEQLCSESKLCNQETKNTLLGLFKKITNASKIK